MPLAIAVLAACTVSGPSGTTGQRAYARRLNAALARTDLVDIAVPGGIAHERSATGGGPADGSHSGATAITSRVWTVADPGPDLLKDVVRGLLAKGTTFTKVFCSEIDDRSVLAIGVALVGSFLAGVTFDIVKRSTGVEVTVSIEADVPNTTPNPLTDLPARSIPKALGPPVVVPACRPEVAAQIVRAYR